MKKILIANRGEIAVRIIRACRELGIKSVAIYSQADAHSLHAKLADESICIGPAESKKSYLHIPAIIAAAEVSGADAIHPGYGFLSENAGFAEICRKCNITFIGPTPEQMRQLGEKVAARDVARKAGLPFLPGSKSAIESIDIAKKSAKEIGFPVILKASGGGGGRGMKIVHKDEDLEKAYFTCRQEAAAAFGNSEVYLEKYLENPRHVEIQIMADKHGNIVHLGERDCSVQRRHQKVIEEAPCNLLNEKERSRIGAYAVALAKEVGYHGAGTVEFLMDDDKNVYFMEMNTRIQVEHPVTEQITGIDLVRTQIQVAMGEALPFSQEDVKIKGHAIECRINAEDPKSFAPWPGKITAYSSPGGLGVRVDGFVYHGYTVVPYYDSMLTKLIVTADTRELAIKKMECALKEFIVDGIRTNIPFHLEVLKHPDFMQGKHSTRFLEKAGFVK
ncbi:acetyl-CoA carboxylase biotin carboxylase subunit [Fluviispira multicolorata]|uniref:Biotin carboxylase n=1 Tax=Fluviispira multicolorata TaxID=2654512 RepID=A0A833JHH5_9BACT|nr:acetyl-CoA carboxylase biotin carboxylase subunit [Fluviispira multicolorata]KAB8033523.1 acetyl-CoA carboxylase biotin carboxylase subunit [Fluviispira multicolorata]